MREYERNPYECNVQVPSVEIEVVPVEWLQFRRRGPWALAYKATVRDFPAWQRELLRTLPSGSVSGGLTKYQTEHLTDFVKEVIHEKHALTERVADLERKFAALKKKGR